MSNNDSVYLVTLKYTSKLLGSGSMIAQFGVDPIHQKISGRADGIFEEGTERPPNFTASFDGVVHSTGLGDKTRAGAGQGQATVSVPHPLLGTYLAPFAMTFSVDNDWNGTGTFSVGSHSYPCEVTLVK